MIFPKPAKIICPHFVGPQAPPQMIFPRPGKIIWPPFVVLGLRPGIYDRVNIQFVKRIKQETGEFVKKNRFIHFMRAEVVSSSIWTFRWEMSLYFTSEWLN